MKTFEQKLARKIARKMAEEIALEHGQTRCKVLQDDFACGEKSRVILIPNHFDLLKWDVISINPDCSWDYMESKLEYDDAIKLFNSVEL